MAVKHQGKVELLCLIGEEIILMRWEEEGRREPVDAVRGDEEEAGVRRPYRQEPGDLSNYHWDLTQHSSQQPPSVCSSLGAYFVLFMPGSRACTGPHLFLENMLYLHYLYMVQAVWLHVIRTQWLPSRASFCQTQLSQTTWKPWGPSALPCHFFLCYPNSHKTFLTREAYLNSPLWRKPVNSCTLCLASGISYHQKELWNHCWSMTNQRPPPFGQNHLGVFSLP